MRNKRTSNCFDNSSVSSNEFNDSGSEYIPYVNNFSSDNSDFDQMSNTLEKSNISDILPTCINQDTTKDTFPKSGIQLLEDKFPPSSSVYDNNTINLRKILKQLRKQLIWMEM